MKRIIIILGCICSVVTVLAQSAASVNPRPLSKAEYEKAKSFQVEDLDNDSYVKFENSYVLDRYEMRKPYFITGDDGLKKRIDLYKLLSKDSMQELGIVIYYTNEKGKRWTAIQPSANSSGDIWETYFEDIHAINKVEENFILKLSYVLSKEMSFQLYKRINEGNDSDDGTYGTDICFPGDQQIQLLSGQVQPLNRLTANEQVEVAPSSHQSAILVTHEAKRYAVNHIILLKELSAIERSSGVEVQLSVRELTATPNHPVEINGQRVTIGQLKDGDQLQCMDPEGQQLTAYAVWSNATAILSAQPVYNISTENSKYLLINGVQVLQK